MTLLNRNELLDALEAERKKCRLENEREGFERAYNIVECMGTEADVELVRRGHWDDECRCTACGWYGDDWYKRDAVRFSYCPNCGAKMNA